MAIEDPLKAYRKENRLSQKALAKKLGVSRGLVSLLETGDRRYTVDMCLRIESKLGIPREVCRPDYFKQAA